MFMQVQNTFLNKGNINYFKVDAENLFISVYFSENDYQTFHFQDRKELDMVVFQLKK